MSLGMVESVCGVKALSFLCTTNCLYVFECVVVDWNNILGMCQCGLLGMLIHELW